jgi:hypothetical protein
VAQDNDRLARAAFTLRRHAHVCPECREKLLRIADCILAHRGKG